MAGAGAVTDAAAAADASTRLRDLCLSAAAGIRHECNCCEASMDGNCNAREEEGGGGGKGGGGAKVSRASGDGDHLAGCGEPLVQLLSRQAARLLALYEVSSSSSPSLPSPIGPGQPAAEKKQNPGAAMRPRQDGQDGVGNGGCGRGDGGGDGDALLILKRLDDLLSVAYSRFYAYLYKDLPLCWRQLYTDASILKFSYLFLSSPCLQPPPPRLEADSSDVAGPPATDGPGPGAVLLPDTQLDEMVKTLDMALILAGGGGHTRGRKWIDAAFVHLESVWTGANGTHHGGSCLTPTAAAIATTITPPPAKKPRLENPPAAHPETWQSLPSFSTHEPFTPPVRHPIRRVSAGTIDMAAFQQHLDCADPHRGPEPLVLTGLVNDWPARTERPWDKPSYLLARTFGGRRLVPVEVGRSYVDEGWGQKIVAFGEFLREYVDPSTAAPSFPAEEAPGGEPAGDGDHEKPVAYLAQHQLFLQLTQLRHDILIPDHCYTAPPAHPTDPSQDQPELEGPLLNAWFGPPGTITPLHTDPYHNLLAQVVGRKYVRLYSPHQTGRMRARGKEGGVEMGNTSLLDVGVVEGWDVDPNSEKDGEDVGESGERQGEVTGEFRTVPFVDCILEPGDGLYIPIGWWHYVRGISVSFSVSLWWN